MRATPAEVKRWKMAARQAKRSLSDWMRLGLDQLASANTADR
jgi:hypothetical protein